MDSPKTDKGHKTSSDHPEKHHQHHEPTNAELMQSAKIVAEAAKSGFKDPEMDRGKVAGATANLLNAANKYGKFEEKDFGRYIDKAEDYLEKYSHTTTTTTHGGSGGHSTTTTTTTTSTTTHSSGHHGDGGKTGGGYGDYMKMAQGFLKK